MIIIIRLLCQLNFIQISKDVILPDLALTKRTGNCSLFDMVHRLESNHKPFKNYKNIFMTHVKFINRPAERSLNNLMEDFFKTTPTAAFKNNVPVNIFESNDAYQLHVISPGFDKKDFDVNIDKNILTISVEKEIGEKENVKQLRSEYTFRPFKRSFTLDEKIDAEKIEASYHNGVLTLNLPFKTEVKSPVKQISIQ